MLSESTLTQNTPGGEDSSESDRGSEVGVPPPATETDRFGFILGNGSTAGAVRSEGPPPELVRQREAKWINIVSQWDRVLLKKSSKVKEQCQKGIPASLRAKCWPLLSGAMNRMHLNNDLYKTLDSRPALQSWVDIIERDLDRQFPFHEMFLSRDGHGQRGLFRVLKAFTQLRPEEGYCQAQGPVAAVLLMNMPIEEAFWCLVQISELYLPGYYSPLLEGVLFDAAMLTWVLKKMCPAAHKHLQRHEVDPLMFATDWLMCLFTRHLPFNTLLRVWDLFFCYGVRVLFQVAVVLVRRALGRVEHREECDGQMETLERLRGVKEKVLQDDDAFIAEVCSVPLSGKDLDKQTEKELEKWRKERPASTFDPRGRCHGYRMVWARVREREEERNRKQRDKGRLSLPLIRSPSALSPSIIHKRWKRGSKSSEGEGGCRGVSEVSEEVREEQRDGGNLRRASEMGEGPSRTQGVSKEWEPVKHKEPSKQEARSPDPCPELNAQHQQTNQGQTSQAPEQNRHDTAQDTSHSQDNIEILKKHSTGRADTEHVLTVTTGEEEESKEKEQEAKTHDKTLTGKNTIQDIQTHAEAKTARDMEADKTRGLYTDKSAKTGTCTDAKQGTETDTGSLTERHTETETETDTDKEVDASIEAQLHRDSKTETCTDTCRETIRGKELEQPTKTNVFPEVETPGECDSAIHIEADSLVEAETDLRSKIETGKHTEGPVNTEVEEPVNKEIEGPIKTKVETEGPVNTEAERPVNNKVEGPVNTEVEGPVNTEVEGPVNTEVEGPVNTEVEGPVNTEVEGPVNTEVEGPLNTKVGAEGPINTEVEEPVNKEILTEGLANNETKLSVDSKVETEGPVNNEVDGPVNKEELTEGLGNKETKLPVNSKVETEGPVNKEAEEPVNKEAEGPANKEAEGPANKESECPINKEIEGPANKETEGPANKETEGPANKEAEGPVNNEELTEGPVNKEELTDGLVNNETKLPINGKVETEGPVNKEAEGPVNKEELTEGPVNKEELTEGLVNNETEIPVNSKVETEGPVNKEAEGPANKEAEGPANKEAECPINKETEGPANKETEGPANKETEGPANKEELTEGPVNTEEFVNNETKLPVNNKIETEEHVNKEAEGPVNKEAEGPANKEAECLINKETEGPANKETEGPANKETEGPVNKEVVGHVKTNVEKPRNKELEGTIKVNQAIETEGPLNKEVGGPVNNVVEGSLNKEENGPVNTVVDGSVKIEVEEGIDKVIESSNDNLAHTEAITNMEVQDTEPCRTITASHNQVSPEVTSSTEPEMERHLPDQDKTTSDEHQCPVTIHPGENQNFSENEEAREEVFPLPSKEGSTDIVTPLHQGEQLRADNRHIQSESLLGESNNESGNSTQADASSKRTLPSDEAWGIPAGDYQLRKSSSSQRHVQKLSADLFTDPNQSQPTSTVSNQSNPSLVALGQMEATSSAPVQAAVPPESPRKVTGTTSTPPPPQAGLKPDREPSNTPKRFGLFRLLRGEQPKHDKVKGELKVTVPQILIQDFSDGVGEGCTVRVEEEEKLSSRERRKRRREQQRREKEQEKLQKKREKELEKEEKERKKERRKPQTRGKSFQVQPSQAPLPRNSGSKPFGSKRNSTPSSEAYF